MFQLLRMVTPVGLVRLRLDTEPVGDAVDVVEITDDLTRHREWLARTSHVHGAHRYQIQCIGLVGELAGRRIPAAAEPEGAVGMTANHPRLGARRASSCAGSGFVSCSSTNVAQSLVTSARRSLAWACTQ